MSLSSKYDFIFTGTGCAALSLVMRMIKSGKFRDKKILLIDKEPKTKNDRTWCFWENKAGFFEDIVYKKWDTISVFGEDKPMHLSIQPYQYKMIRGIDFYNYCFTGIAQHPNIDIIYGDVQKSFCHKEGITIHLDDKVLELEHAIVFNSFFSKENNEPASGKEIDLLQHFMGWVIETETPSFNPAEATFMDFRVEQSHGTTFGYVLPFSETNALVEYTLFSEFLLKKEEYEIGLKKYINDLLKISSYKITEKEFGVIPMTTRRFEFYSNNVYNIGTAGGQTKGSSGYTFQFIQKQAELIKDFLIKGKALFEMPPIAKRFQFYDRVLLDVLYNKGVSGKEIFTSIFRKNDPLSVLRFLDNESSIGEDLKIISSLPALPFLKSALHRF